MRVLVTGASGFLGGTIAKQLIARGDEVIGAQRTHKASLEQSGVTQVLCDLGEQGALTQALHAHPDIDAVIHTAAKAGMWGAYDDYHRANVLGTQHVIDACRAHSIRTLVYTSTPSVTHQATTPVEGLSADQVPYACHVKAAYPHTKILAEQAALAAHDDDLKVVALRPRLIWGPGDPHLLPGMVARAKQGKLKLIGDGQNKIDTTYISNAADAHLAALDALQQNPNAACGGKAYFISNGEPWSIKDVLNGLLAAADAPLVTKHVPFWLGYAVGGLSEWVHRLGIKQGEPIMTRFLAEQLVTPHWYDMEPAKRDFGYQPRVSMNEGMQRLRQHLQETPP